MIDPLRAYAALPLGGDGAASRPSGQAPIRGQGPTQEGGSDTVDLSPEAQAKVAELRKGDEEVHAHEAAHQGAAGGLARGGATYSYKRGPDGQLYAVAGEVSLDTSPVQGDPRATLAKAQRIIAAALAPANPSPQDRAVAAEASAMAAKASAELGKGKGAEAPSSLHLLA